MKQGKYQGKYSAGGGKKKKTLAIGLGITAVLLAVVIVGLALALMGRNQEPEPQIQNAVATTQTIAPETAATTVPTVETTVPETEDPEKLEKEPTVPEKLEGPEETKPTIRTMLPQYVEKYNENPEFYGWIRIDGTRIDYPLMHSPEEPDKYLYADFDGNYLYAGSIYADAKCSFDTDNMLIYGHNMLDGSRFRTLMNYENKAFWETHPTIMVSDLYEEYEYEIVAAFRDRVYKKTETCFKFYQFIDAANEQEFDDAIAQFKAKAAYDTGVEAHYGDHLITLITCAYHVDHGRFVVVARRK